MRKLASVRKIKELRPIEGADRIELSIIDGWQVIVKKDDFKVGDKCIYFEIDSVLPPKQEYDFMQTRKYKVKTIRLKGVISQGLALPYNGSLEEGSDLTESLEVKHIDDLKPIVQNSTELYRKPKGFFKYLIWRIKNLFRSNTPGRLPFPWFLQKTDQERYQNYSDLTREFDKVEHEDIIMTEKLDGTSFTAYYHKGKFGICSRNYELARKVSGTEHYFDIVEKHDIKTSMKTYFEMYLKSRPNIVGFFIQGEIIGPSIQKNRYNLKEKGLFIFNTGLIKSDPNNKKNIIKEDDNYYLSTGRCFCLGIDYVPFKGLYSAKNKDHDTILNNLLEYSKLTSSLRKEAIAEGIVIRSNSNKVSMKCINPEYLLANQEVD
jgi:hypothetical protein